MNEKKLTRSRTDKFIGGVCGGLANYLGMDAGLVRILAVVLGVVTQVGWVAYLVLWAVLPQENDGPTGLDEAKAMFSTKPPAPPTNPTDPNPGDYR
ncbi:MAG: PspC domain-containing protein [Micropruina sp.]|nr:PspC domain-containing protein [Micropruina sp.]